jgi:hypothetical protein
VENFHVDLINAQVKNGGMWAVPIVFAFLVLGSMVFLGCVLFRPTRQYALSAAVWCAMWAPCSVGVMTAAGLGLVAMSFLTKAGAGPSFQSPKQLATFGWGFLIFGVLATTVIATGAAWLHQMLVRRVTYALFRLYASVVSAGIGSVFGLCLGWWMMSKELMTNGWPLWSLSMLVLIAGFGTLAYRGARGLRGEAPKTFTWITPEEFAGL